MALDPGLPDAYKIFSALPASIGAGGGVASAAAPAAGLASRLPSWLSLTKGTGVRALGYPALGYIGGQIENKLVGEHPGTSWDEAGTGAVTGAGVGAGIGSIVPGIGTGIGAGVGALAGGLIGLFGPKSNGTGQQAVSRELSKQTQRVTNLINQFSLPDEIKQQALQQLQLQSSGVNSNTAVRAAGDELIAQLTTATPSIISQQLADKQKSTRQAALQAWLTPVLQKQNDTSQGYADQLAAQLRNNAASLPAGLQGVANAQAANISSDRAAANSAILQQLALTPQLYGYNTGTDANGNANQDLLSVLSGQPVGGGQQQQATGSTQTAAQQQLAAILAGQQ